MTDDSALSDLARLREIAEEGRRLPLMGGRHMILWGCAVIVASLFHWAVFSQFLPLPAMSVAFGWFGITGLASIAGRLPLFVREKHRTSKDLGNRIERRVWEFGGSAIGLISLSIFLTAMVTQQQSGSPRLFDLFMMMPPISFSIYAIALRVTAEAAGLDALKPYALAAFLFVPLTIALAGSPAQLLATAIGIFVVAVLPGRLLLALEKAQDNG